jgi:hypothetical protein
LLKHQLLTIYRSRQRTPNLITLDCCALDFFERGYVKSNIAKKMALRR